MDLEVNLLLVSEVRLTTVSLRSQLTRARVIVFRLLEITDQAAMMLSRSGVY